MQTIEIDFVIKDAQLTNYLTLLDTTNGVYDAFVENNSTFHKNRWKDRYQDTIVNVRKLEAIIGQYFESFRNTHGHFKVLFDVYTNIAAKLSNLKMTFPSFLMNFLSASSSCSRFYIFVFSCSCCSLAI